MQQQTPNNLQSPEDHIFPFEVIMFICSMSHTLISIVGCLAIVFGHVPSEDDYCYNRPTATKKIINKVIKVFSIILVILNALFSLVTFFASIFVANVTDQQRWSTALSVYNASTLFLIIEACIIVPYMVYRIETTRRERLKIH